jgi:hypothetical protein
MKLAEHVDKLKNRIEAAFDKNFARLGIGRNKPLDIEKLPEDVRPKRLRFEEMLETHTRETGDYEHARVKLIDELTFTLFNRLAAVKVMEAAALFPPVLTKLPEHGDRSFGHKAWLEMNPHMRSEELEGIREYIIYEFDNLGETLPLYNRNYPYALLPDAISLNEIIDAFNAVERDSQVGNDIWQSDDVLGWMYESYNNKKKQEHKDSKDKTEYNKVSLQSQFYTPRWVVQFLVDNALGKLYLEMYPDSEIRKRYKIANVGTTEHTENTEKENQYSVSSVYSVVKKNLHEIKLIDPVCGSGNFLLYAFDLFYELYVDQIDNYGADYDEKDIPKLIIENNLHGIDLDDRAVQLAQLGLFIKAKKKRRTIGELAFNVVSSDFYLPEYETVAHIFTEGSTLDKGQQELIAEIWNDLQYSYKFGSLIRLDEKVKAKLKMLEDKQSSAQPELFTAIEIETHKNFTATFFANLNTAVVQYAQAQGNTFLTSKTRDAITFLELLTTEYDVATANPPYTPSSDFGPILKKFINLNYSNPLKFNKNLYSCFIEKCCSMVTLNGKIALIHPSTFMFIKDFVDVRKFLLNNTCIETLVDHGQDRINLFDKNVTLDAVYYVLGKNTCDSPSLFLHISNDLEERAKRSLFHKIFSDYVNGIPNDRIYLINQGTLHRIKTSPFIYWISDGFQKKFESQYLDDFSDNISVGIQLPGGNEKNLRFFWEVKDTDEKYRRYHKGGAFNKWLGNNWLVVNSRKIQIKKSEINKMSLVGFTTGRQSSKGASFRWMRKEDWCDNGTANIFFSENQRCFFSLLALLNSKICLYLLDCFNPTVNKQSGDLKKIPVPKSFKASEERLHDLTKAIISIKCTLLKYDLRNPEYSCRVIDNPFRNFRESIFNFMDLENLLTSRIHILESMIDAEIFKVYDLTEDDQNMVFQKKGECIAMLPVKDAARSAFLKVGDDDNSFDDIKMFVEELPSRTFSADEEEQIVAGFPSLYQSNNELEEFCIRHQVNPINVWYWFKQSNVIPQLRMHTLAMEFLADMVREILMEDEDGIIPLVPNAGEKVLLDRVEEKFREKGFSPSQYSSFDTVLGRPVHSYLNEKFFSDLSERLNLFRHLPMTPFIWHLSSGPEQGFDCYIIIYKWTRDKLMRLRSIYIEHRERSLVNRQSDLSENESAEAQNEKDLIFRQLKEIEDFKAKIDELLAEGYNPILDDGVGKNIAPLQKKKMIPYEVLNAGQLKKYLNADW